MTQRDAVERVAITAYLGSPRGAISDGVVDALCVEITRAYGGVSVSRVAGYWAPNGENDSGPYDVEGLKSEEAVKIDLLLYPDQTEAAITLLRKEISNLNRRHDLGLKHVHVETAPRHAFHFRVD